MSRLYHLDALTVTVFVVALAAVAFEAGFRVADRQSDRRGVQAGIGAVEGIVFGLFGLLIAFTFSFVVTRAELRRQLVVEETNAIETSYLLSAIAPARERAELEALHRRYLDSRVAFIQAGIDEQGEAQALAASQSVQDALWAQAVAVAHQDHSSEPYGLLLHALGDVFSARSKRTGALEARLPDAVVVLLLITAVLTASVTGYALGLKGERHPVPSAVFLILTAVVLYIILDIDRPRRGLLRTSEDALVQLADRLGTKR